MCALPISSRVRGHWRHRLLGRSILRCPSTLRSSSNEKLGPTIADTKVRCFEAVIPPPLPHPAALGPGWEGGVAHPRGPRRRSERGDRKSVVQGKSVSVRVELGGRRTIKNKKHEEKWTKRN